MKCSRNSAKSWKLTRKEVVGVDFRPGCFGSPKENSNILFIAHRWCGFNFR